MDERFAPYSEHRYGKQKRRFIHRLRVEYYSKLRNGNKYPMEIQGTIINPNPIKVNFHRKLC